MSVVPENMSPSTNLVGFNLDDLMKYMQIAEMLKSSCMIPKEMRGDIGTVLIVIELAVRTGLPLMALFQGMYIVPGSAKPSFYSSLLHTMIRKSGYFVSTRYDEEELEGRCLAEGEKNCRCRFVGVLPDGSEVEGPYVSLNMAVKAGWYNNKVWKSYAKTMLQNRAVSFFVRQRCPELIFGIDTEPEIRMESGSGFGESGSETMIQRIKNEKSETLVIDVTDYQKMVARIKDAKTEDGLKKIANEIKEKGFAEDEIKCLREVWKVQEAKIGGGKPSRGKKAKAPQNELREPAADEVKASVSKVNEVKMIEPKVNEPKVSEVKVNEVKVSEVKVNESKMSGLNLDVVKAGEPMAEEVLPEEVQLEEVLPEEGQQEEALPEEVYPVEMDVKEDVLPPSLFDDLMMAIQTSDGEEKLRRIYNSICQCGETGELTVEQIEVLRQAIDDRVFKEGEGDLFGM